MAAVGSVSLNLNGYFEQRRKGDCLTTGKKRESFDVLSVAENTL